MIPFNKPPYIGLEYKYVLNAMKSDKISGDGYFSKKCEEWFEKKLYTKKALLTPSCTAALEMAAILIDIKKGDEVIMPSYTFVSTANAFVLRGAKIKFVDINPKTMNIDEEKIKQAITNKTKAIVVVHYAGISPDMDKITEIAKKHNLYVIEDAAQAIISKYKNRYLGTIGDLGCFSFHETKNITSGGEGGVLLVNNEKFIKRAEIIREKGTNRKAFFRGEIDKYSWVDIGSSYLMNEISAAYLFAQLENIDLIIKNRLDTWQKYYEGLESLNLELPYVPEYAIHNGHIFYIKTDKRDELLKYLNKKGIKAVFHYVPLHTSPAGKKFGEFVGKDKWTTKESKRLIRLPLFYGIKEEEIQVVITSIKEYLKNDRKKFIKL